jgi:hypothetical protein
MIIFGMALESTVRRRWVVAVLLGGAVLMVLAGETLLKNRLSPAAFFGYWLVCLVLTCQAMLLALRELRAVQHRSREEQRQLIESTLKEIQAEAKTKPIPGPAANPPTRAGGSKGGASI